VTAKKYFRPSKNLGWRGDVCHNISTDPAAIAVAETKTFCICDLRV